jgi:hypothetical protein
MNQSKERLSNALESPQYRCSRVIELEGAVVTSSVVLQRVVRGAGVKGSAGLGAESSESFRGD